MSLPCELMKSIEQGCVSVGSYRYAHVCVCVFSRMGITFLRASSC